MGQRWLITGAGRGLGADIARAALAAGCAVAATGRDPEAVRAALGPEHERLLVLGLDVMDAAQAQRAAAAAQARFGGIDVLVNNAGYGHVGFFEETTDADARAQFEANVFGLMNVTRAVLPLMRKARAGHVVNLSSLAGLRGNMFTSLYSASKFAVEGLSEALAEELAPFGIRITIVEPGPFRTDFLTARSLRVGAQALPDYDAMRAKMLAGFEARNGKQAGDPARLARAVVEMAGSATAPLRFLAGSQAFDMGVAKLNAMREDITAWEAASRATDGDYEDVQALRLR
jgi:NAD(P)-dependent dehydrogenase (short-subunit alcohol dehydrogenase family)